jgi:DNA repair exonuclease SbcCD ATPase subunit
MWEKFLEMIGIQMMKTEQKMEDSIDKIDRAQYALKQDENRLKELEGNLTKARENYNVHKKTRENLEADLERKGRDLKELISNYSQVAMKDNPGLDSIALKEFVSNKIAENVDFDILKQNIDMLKEKLVIGLQVEKSHEDAVADLSKAIGEVRRTLAYNKNQLEIISSKRSAAQATLEAATLSSTAGNTSTKRIEEANTANIRLEASAEAQRDLARDNPNVNLQIETALTKSRAAVMSDDISALIDESIAKQLPNKGN